jgi:hypothetical protein
MSRFNLMLIERLKRSSRVTIAGIALIGSAAAFHFIVSKPMQDRARQLQQDLATAKSKAGKFPDKREPRDIRSVDMRFNEFYQYFPPTRSTPDSLGIIYKAAEKEGIHLIEGDYKIVPVKGDKLVGYQISLPVRGTYTQLRKFIVQLLNETPAASLDELNFKRDAIANNEVEAKVRLTLYLRVE